MVGILQATTGAKDSTNTYVREIPLLGIDRVWEDISTQSSPNFSDLGVTVDAMKRMEEGLKQFRKRFATKLPELEKFVGELLKK